MITLKQLQIIKESLIEARASKLPNNRLTERLKDDHEPIIRSLASLGRADYMRKQDNDEDGKKHAHDSRAQYGDCDTISHHVADRLRHTYPSVKVKYTHRFGHKLPEDPHGENGMTGHSWVEIPETGHYIDPSHDMFRIHGGRQKIATKRGRFHGGAVKIGKTSDSVYKKNYGDHDRIVYQDKSWSPGKATKNKKSNR